jgi:hypothetical protein
MTSARRRASGAALVALGVLLGGCGGQPQVTPAGSAGLEAPYDDDIAPAGTSTVRPIASPSPGASVNPPPAIPLPSGTFSPPKPVKRGAKGETAAPSAPDDPAPVIPPSNALVLPKLGTYTYALTGSSSLGKPPATMKLAVDSAGGGDEQIWTQDARRADGAGIIEELTLSRQADGIYLSAYRIDGSTGIAAVVLEFAPPSPVLLEPDGAKPGQTWKFDLESKDGCTASHTDAVLVSDAKPGGDGATSLRHVRLTTTLRTIGPPTCAAVSAKRVYDTYHATGAALPTRIDSDLSGTLGAVPVKSDTQAILTSPTPKSAARLPDRD